MSLHRTFALGGRHYDNNTMREVARRLNFNNNSNSNATQPLPISVKNVPLPNNAPQDPISLHNFNKGDMAIRIRHNGKNTYLTLNSFNGWFGNKWKTIPWDSNRIISMKTHPMTRARVRRRNVRKIKFV
jgi:hypothetical protein